MGWGEVQICSVTSSLQQFQASISKPLPPLQLQIPHLEYLQILTLFIGLSKLGITFLLFLSCLPFLQNKPINREALAKYICDKIHVSIKKRFLTSLPPLYFTHYTIFLTFSQLASPFTHLRSLPREIN